MDQLKEHPQIVELLGTLDKNGLMKEKSEVQSLVSYIGGMEETLTEMLGELQDMRREINLIHNNTLRSKCHTLVEKTEGKIRQGFSAVKKMKDNLIQSAGNAVRAFRERGRDALAESVRAMKIPEALDKLSAMFGRMSKEMAQDTKKLSAMQTELQGAKHRDDGDQRIAQGMLGNNGELGQALGAGGADVILAHNFQQTGAHQAGQVADGIAAHSDDGQDVALPAVQAEGRQYVQLKGEYINQHGGDHERRNGNADGGNGHQQHILPFAVFQRR